MRTGVAFQAPPRFMLRSRRIYPKLVPMQSQPIVPPAPKVHAKDLPLWRFLPAFSRNTVSTLPDYAFDVLIYRRRVLGIESMLVNDPEGVKHVLGTAIGKYKRPMSSYRVFRPFAGNGVLLADGCEWRRQRRMLAPILEWKPKRERRGAFP